MLVLTRRVGERVRIGADIVLVVLGIEHGQVRVGVEAPRTVPVQREEIYEALAEANRSAAERPEAEHPEGVGNQADAPRRAERAFQ